MASIRSFLFGTNDWKKNSNGSWTHTSTSNSNAGGALFSGIKNAWNSLTGNKLTDAAREQNEYNAQQAEIARNFSAQQADIARDWDEQMYNKYNSPSAMIRQYAEAGVNPAIMYGNGGASVGGNMNMSSPVAGSAQASAAGQVAGTANLQQLLSLFGFGKQMKQMQAGIDKTNAEARLTQINADIEERTGMAKRLLELKSAQANTDLTEEERNKKHMEYLTLEKEYQYLDTNIQLQQGIMRSNINLNEKQSSYVEQQTKNLMEQYDWIGPTAAAQIGLSAAQAELARKDGAQYVFNHLKTMSYGSAKSMGLSIKGLGISNSISENTQVLVGPSEDGKGLKIYAVSGDMVNQEDKPKDYQSWKDVKQDYPE